MPHRFAFVAHRTLVVRALTAGAALLASACMTSPFDGQVVPRSEERIKFAGNHLAANAPVTIEAENPSTRRFEVVTATTSGASGFDTYDGKKAYPWSVEAAVPARLWDVGFVGRRAKVRAVGESGPFMSVNEDWSDCYFSTSTLTDYQKKCAAKNSPVAVVRTPGAFVPARGDTTCAYGSKECNRCVRDVAAEIRALELDKRDSHEFEFNMPHKLLLRAHLQGVARIPGVGDDNWFVASQHDDESSNWGRAGLKFGAFGHKSNGGPWKFAQGRREKGSIRHRLHTPDTYHPGGIQVTGHILAVANACDRKCRREGPWVDLYDVSNPEAVARPVNALTLGRAGEPKLGKSITAVGITRLEDGRYFVLATSEGSDREGRAWAYVSSDTTLRSGTTWSYLGFLEGDSTLQDWASHYENINLLTECGSGRIYLTAMKADGGRAGDSHFIDVYRMEPGLRTTRLFREELTARVDGCSLRDGGGFHVSPNGKLVFYCVEGYERVGVDGVTDPELEEFRDKSFDDRPGSY